MAAERLAFGEAVILIRTSAEETSGAFALFEELEPMLDTPLHVHENEDELFYILDGEHICVRGEEEHRLGPGDTIFLPRGVPHAHRRVEPGRGRLLALVSPGGFEGFFRRLADADAAGTLGPEAYASASAEFRITWL
jgi:mannose-6-phosphate isomerase-like protein (cupin superfamily)